MTSAAPSYTFASNNKKYAERNDFYRKSKGNHHRRSMSEDMDDGNGSMTYSAGSSVQSGGSSAGESTDSSFADIMRVLDLQDSKELHALIKKEGVSSANELREKRGLGNASGISVASSLNYSTDGESHLEGTKLLQTIAGQPSDSYAFDGSSGKEEPITGDVGDILFAPAVPADVKKKKKRSKSAVTTTPKSKNSSRKNYDSSPSPSQDTPTRSPPSESRPGTPPIPPKAYIENDEEVWYAQWWIACFPDTFKNMMPKR